MSAQQQDDEVAWAAGLAVHRQSLADLVREAEGRSGAAKVALQQRQARALELLTSTGLADTILALLEVLWYYGSGHWEDIASDLGRPAGFTDTVRYPAGPATDSDPAVDEPATAAPLTGINAFNANSGRRSVRDPTQQALLSQVFGDSTAAELDRAYAEYPDVAFTFQGQRLRFALRPRWKHTDAWLSIEVEGDIVCQSEVSHNPNCLWPSPSWYFDTITVLTLGPWAQLILDVAHHIAISRIEYRTMGDHGRGEGLPALDKLITMTESLPKDPRHDRDAIVNRLTMLLSEEDAGAPLSDRSLCDGIRADGLASSPRAVASLRNELGIPPARLRSQASQPLSEDSSDEL